MTNEEAIKELEQLDAELIKIADCGNKTVDRMSAGRKRKALSMAKKALKCQSSKAVKTKHIDGFRKFVSKLEGKEGKLAVEKLSYNIRYCPSDLDTFKDFVAKSDNQTVDKLIQDVSFCPSEFQLAPEIDECDIRSDGGCTRCWRKALEDFA